MTMGVDEDPSSGWLGRTLLGCRGEGYVRAGISTTRL